MKFNLLSTNCATLQVNCSGTYWATASARQQHHARNNKFKRTNEGTQLWDTWCL